MYVRQPASPLRRHLPSLTRVEEALTTTTKKHGTLFDIYMRFWIHQSTGSKRTLTIHLFNKLKTEQIIQYILSKNNYFIF